MSTFRAVVDINWSHGTGAPGANVFHGRTTGTLGSADEEDALLLDLKAFYTAMAAFATSDTRFSFSGEIMGLGDDAGDSRVIDPWTVQGGGGSPALSTALQVAVSWRTGSGGRSGRGRTFFGPLSALAGTADGLPTAVVVGDLQTAATNLIEAGAGRLDGAWGVYSPQDNVIRDFTGASVKRQFAVLKSRRD
uniref:Uncharacterized protein n=1 Tax=uncultured prokaryote TaxID=198431 RepID=A0A0H5Q7C4_9ZZZZ|nr:hypothetical protein [uncultured prokaryote]